MKVYERKENAGLSRRDFLKRGVILGAATAGASVLGACSPQTSGNTTDAGASSSDGTGNTTSESMNTEVIYSSYDYSAIKGKSEAAETGTYQFQHIDQPVQLGPFMLKNRMVKSASSGMEYHGPMDLQAIFYREIAKGGAAMIVFPVMAMAASDADAEAYKVIADAVHEYDVPFFAQIVGSGSERSSTVDIHAPLGAPIFKAAEPGGVPAMILPSMPNVMQTTEQVQATIEQFAQSSYYLKTAGGFDGVEINAAAEHYFDSFLSRFWNQERTDQYSGESIENRCRIITELIARIHELCGEDFPVGVLYNGAEVNVLYPGDNSLCSTVDETREMARLFEEAGASHLHIRSVTFGNHTAGFFPDLLFASNKPNTTYGHFYDIKRWWPDYVADYGGAGAFLETAARIKEAVSIPVFPVAMMDPRLLPDVIDEAIGAGKIDGVFMSRRFYADLGFPNKISAGDLADIRPCANCTHCLQGYCRVNPAFARGGTEEMPEGYTPAPVSTPKNVLVAGGGPAGLEAAHIAAERGHNVTIYEKDSVWGGATASAIAVKGPHEKIQDHIDWLVKQCEDKGVTMNLNTEVTVDLVASEAPDAVIVATGGLRPDLNISGADNAGVESGFISEGQKVVVIGGIQCEGVQAAIYMAEQGKEVTLIDELSDANFGWIMPDWLAPQDKYYCQTHGVNILTGVRYGSITDKTVIVTLDHDGIEMAIEYDRIVNALPCVPNTSLADVIKSSVSEVYTIGDANEHGLIREAVYAGNITARKI